MFQFKRDFHELFCGARDVARSRQLNPSLLTFEQRWLAQHKTQIRAISPRSARSTGIWIDVFPRATRVCISLDSPGARH